MRDSDTRVHARVRFGYGICNGTNNPIAIRSALPMTVAKGERTMRNNVSVFWGLWGRLSLQGELTER